MVMCFSRKDLALALMSAFLVSGCSTPDIKDPKRALEPKAPELKEVRASESETQAAILIDLTKDPEGKFKSEIVSEIPDWIASADVPSQNLWRSFQVNPRSALSSFFEQEGLDTEWMQTLRRSDYYDLSTIYDGQVFHVNLDRDGNINQIYTLNHEGDWLYIHRTETGFFVSKHQELQRLASSVYLSPETKYSDLSEVQQRAVNSYLTHRPFEKMNPLSIPLSKGKVRIYYQSLIIDHHSVIRINIEKTEIKHRDKTHFFVPY